MPIWYCLSRNEFLFQIGNITVDANGNEGLSQEDFGIENFSLTDLKDNLRIGISSGEDYKI